MIVVSDTSVISNLHLVGLLNLLPKLFKSVVIPQKVFDELLELERFEIDIQAITNANFITVQMPANRKLVQELLITLDEGEAQAITPAL